MADANGTVVFSDLDGTLLDHETYSWDAARPALALLKARAIPLVLASSKTAAEIAPLRAAMGFSDCPAIVENGAGILEPGEDGGDGDSSVHDRLLAILDSLPSALRDKFSGFSGWTVDDIAARTGLSPDDAAKSARRRFSEPGIWSGDDARRSAFETALAVRGVTARTGGRFLTLSFGASKANRMAEIADRYRKGVHRPRVIALGDAPNDREMLEAADFGVIVANPHGQPLPVLDGERTGRIERTEKTGPQGWNESVLRLVQGV